MEYQKSNFVYRALRAGALAAAGIELILGPGCAYQPTVRENIRNEINQSRADDARYAALPPEEQKEELQSQLKGILKDGKVDASGLPTLAKIIKRAETHKDILKQAEGARDAYLQENPIKVFYTFATRQGTNMEWRFLEPERRAELAGDLKTMATDLGFSIDELLAKIQGPNFPGRELPQRDWSQEQFDTYNDFLHRETVRVPETSFGRVSAFFPTGGLTDGDLTVSKEEYDSWAAREGHIVNGRIYAIAQPKPVEKKPEADKDKKDQPKADEQPAKEEKPKSDRPASQPDDEF